MKEHQSQIQTIIKDTLAKPLVHCNDLVTKVIDAKQESKEMNNTENEHSQPPKVSDHNEQLDQLSSAISANSSQTLSQAYANEESELKYLLIKDELTKRQHILDEVLLINEALRIKIKEYEVDNLNLPLVKIPTTTIHTSAQTVDSMELVEKRKFELMQAVNDLNQNRNKRENLENFTKCKMIKSIASHEEIAGSLSVMSSIKSNQSNSEDDSMITLNETISKLKVDEQRRKKRLEKLVLKNFSLKLEIFELKKEIKKYSNVWANDRYFNSLFLDATKQMITK